MNEEYESIKKQREKLENQIAEAEDENPDFINTQEYRDLVSKIADLDFKEQDLREEGAE